MVSWSSPSSRRAWIEIIDVVVWRHNADLSPSSRRAWIEITNSVLVDCRVFVALLAEGVDRNRDHNKDREPERVALLAEGVDRN